MTQLFTGVLRKAIALLGGILVSILAVTPLALAIKYYDWGVGLILVAPVLIWLLLRMGTALERWARNEPDTRRVDPDFPDEDK